MIKISICGNDPSFRHWGIAVGEYCLVTNRVVINHLDVIEPVLTKSKQVRQNSLDVEASKQIFESVYRYTKDAQVVFAEVPVGSQNSRAATAFGVCVGVLGCLNGLGISINEVTPTQVKVAAVNNKTATKQQMITWASMLHPEANWPTYNHKGKTLITESKAEHMADAIGSIYAGIASPHFQQLLNTLKKANYAN
jgi:Holliday junction resolvasome RuvABC endonuclease subunit